MFLGPGLYQARKLVKYLPRSSRGKIQDSGLAGSSLYGSWNIQRYDLSVPEFLHLITKKLCPRHDNYIYHIILSTQQAYVKKERQTITTRGGERQLGRSRVVCLSQPRVVRVL